MTISFDSFSAISTVALIFILGAVPYLCRAAVITANVDGFPCPGEELVYTCVSQGTSQRWIIENEDRSRIDQVYASGDELGVIVQNDYTFTLKLASHNQFKSMVSVTATISIHNTVLECTGHSSRASATIQIAGTPTSPLNLQSVVDEYHDHFSTVLFTWDAPNDDSRVDYYDYRVVNETSTVAYNTSNTSVLIFGLVYNKKVTFSVLAGNCIGESAPQMKIVDIVGCSKLDDTVSVFDINHSTFSQAPGTEVLLSCNLNNGDEIIRTTCQDDGRWEPDVSSMLCRLDDPNDTTLFMPNYSTVTPDDDVKTTSAEAGMSLILIYALAASMAVGLCILAGVIIGCIYKLTLHLKRGKPAMEFEGGAITDSSTSQREVNYGYYEVIDPIYEVINTGSNHFGTQINMIMMENNDAYENIKFKETASHAPEGIDVAESDNEAYVQIAIEPTMEHNNSYQASHFNLNFFVSQKELTVTGTQNCYDKQSMGKLKNIQQTISCNEAPLSQNNEQIEIYHQERSSIIPLCVEDLDMNSTVTNSQNGSNKLACEQKGVCKPI